MNFWRARTRPVLVSARPSVHRCYPPHSGYVFGMDVVYVTDEGDVPSIWYIKPPSPPSKLYLPRVSCPNKSTHGERRFKKLRWVPFQSSISITRYANRYHSDFLPGTVSEDENVIVAGTQTAGCVPRPAIHGPRLCQLTRGVQRRSPITRV